MVCHLKLAVLSSREDSGIPGVAVKCVDIWKTTPDAKAAIWLATDAEARKRGEQTGLDTPGSPRCKRWVLGVGLATGQFGAAANALSTPPWGVRSQG